MGARESLNGRENMARRKEKNGEKSPWGQCLTRPTEFQTVAVVLASDWCQKTFVFFCNIIRISTLRYLLLNFLFTVRLGNNKKKDSKNCPLFNNSGLARARIISKKKTAVHKDSFANPFSDFLIER